MGGLGGRGRRCRTLASLGLVLLAVLAASSPSAHLRFPAGSPLPDLEFDALLSAEDYGRLGLAKRSGRFLLSDIPGDVLLLEFFNKSCVPCQRQVRHVEAAYQVTLSEPLRGRVRILAIAAGNQAKYLTKYRESRGLTYPITADPQFDQWRRLGEPGRTPFTVYLVRQEGRWVLSGSHFGIQTDADILGYVRALLQEPLAVIGRSGREPPPAPPKELPLDEEGVRRLARQLLSRAAGKPVEAEPLTLAGGVRIFRARAEGRPLDLYAKVGSREPVCEVCHAVHFMFAFDRAGKVRGFEPIHVTKYGNDLWNADENEFFESRLRDRPMAGLSFDPEMDAVSMATMSSALIFDEIRRTVELLNSLSGI